MIKDNVYCHLGDHRVYIPVMGTAFTIDSPLKVARFGMASVVSLCDDELCETMRAFYSKQYHLDYKAIEKDEEDARARRITAYLNLLDFIIKEQMARMKMESFSKESELTRYFELLEPSHPNALLYQDMLEESDESQKKALQAQLKECLVAGNIDVNIMTKLDRDNRDANNQPLPQEFSDALAALRGFANSNVKGNIVFSAGFNRRLYAYCEQFDDFYPDKEGKLKKGIVLKVSDFRSTTIQGTFFAKKGLWVTEYRIESGLNCGGHAFATDGLLMGPILQQFKDQKKALCEKLFNLCQASLEKKERQQYSREPQSYLTFQGGLGNTLERNMLHSHYNVDATGWGSPFLLVPEVSVVDLETRKRLAEARENDFYLSGISPLGVPFNTVAGTASEAQKNERAELGRPGSPCPKGFLKLYNTEFTKVPVCEASVLYQKRKLKALEEEGLSPEQLAYKKDLVLAKACLCEDLAASALTVNDLENKRPLKTAICPGPNLAYFDKTYTFKEMMDHIYGRTNILNPKLKRPHVFFKEAQLYVSYFEREIKAQKLYELDLVYLERFYKNFLEGIAYYKNIKEVFLISGVTESTFEHHLKELKYQIDTLWTWAQHEAQKQGVQEPVSVSS